MSSEEKIERMAKSITEAFNRKCYIRVVNIWNDACENLPVKDIKMLHGFPAVGLMVVDSVKNLEKDGLIEIDREVRRGC